MGSGTWVPQLPGMMLAGAFLHPAPLPRTIIHYLMPHARYSGVFDTGDLSAPDETVTPSGSYRGATPDMAHRGIGPACPPCRDQGREHPHLPARWDSSPRPRHQHRAGLRGHRLDHPGPRRKTVATAPFIGPGRRRTPSVRLPARPPVYAARLATRKVPYAALHPGDDGLVVPSGPNPTSSALPPDDGRLPGTRAERQNQAASGNHRACAGVGDPRAGAARSPG